MPKSYDDVEEEYMHTGKTGKSFFRLVRDMAKMKKETTLMVLAVISTAISGTLYPLALAEVINNITAKNLHFVFLFAAIFFGLYVAQFFANRIRTITSTKLAQSTIKNLRDRSFNRLQYVPIEFFSKVKTGYLMSRITNDAETLSEFLTFQLPSVVSGITTVIVSIGIMMYLDFNLTMYSLVVIPILAGFSIAIQGRVRKNYLRTRRTIAAITGNLAENIGAIRTIKAFNVEDRTGENFDGLNVNNFDANMKAARLSSLYGMIVRVIEALGIALVLYVGSLQLLGGFVSVGILVAFVVYVEEFFDPVIQLSQLYNSYQSSMVGVSRIYGIIDSEKESDYETSNPVGTFSSSIDFRDVTVTFGSTRALDDVNLSIKKGEKVAIVGHTGAGKTTLSNLILKFQKTTSGSVTVDGKDITEISTKSYRQLIAPVLQEPFMFRGTVYENIKFAKSDAGKEEINEIVDKFGLRTIFDSLPDGLESNVGEMGRNLSEGQRQAVSIIRAFIRDPEILIMDEATSQIDPRSEYLIIQALQKFLANKTLILITHRFSLIQIVDRIVVMELGKMVQTGEFSDLVNREGLFRDLYRIQRGMNYS